jgi:uncharacterized membrane protein YbaN (DUF454 family)
MAGGGLAFVLGMIGIVLPIMPTVPFLLLAAFCFSRSHPHLADRLYDHPHYGPAMRNWRDRRAISRKAKLSALAAMAVGAGVTWYLVGWPWAAISIAILLIAGSWIWTRSE